MHVYGAKCTTVVIRYNNNKLNLEYFNIHSMLNATAESAILKSEEPYPIPDRILYYNIIVNT